METIFVFKVSSLSLPAKIHELALDQKILNKSAELFLSHGFKSVTMDEIAHELGVSKKTIYAHFPTKTKLVEAVTDKIYFSIIDGIDAIRALDKDPIEEMYEIKKFMMSRLKGEKASPIYQLKKFYPEIFARIQRNQFEKMQECTVENLKRGMKKGVYRKDLNLDFISRMYFSGMNCIKDESLFPKNEFAPKSLHEVFLNYHLRGIVTPSGLETLNKMTNQKKNK